VGTDLVSSAMSDVLFPSAEIFLTAGDRDSGRRYVQDASRALLLGLLPLTILFASTTEALLGFLYSDTYATDTSVLPLQGFTFALFGIDAPMVVC